MADGDRFERRLRSPGWRKVYRLACGNASLDILRDELISAVAAAMRGPLPFPDLPNAVHAVYKALQDKAVLKSAAAKSLAIDPYRTLTSKFGQSASGENFVAREIEAKVVQIVYLELESHCHLITLQRVADRFAVTLVERIIRQQFSAKVREGIAIENARSPEEQLKWEHGLFSHLASRSKEMLGPILSNARVLIRAPKRLTPQRKMTREELDRPLA